MRAARPSSLELEALEPDDPVRIRREAPHPRAVSCEDAAVPEQDPRHLADHDLGGPVVELFALGRARGLSRFGQERVHLGIAVVAVVLRAVAGGEGENVAVGIRPAAPEGEVGLEVAPAPRLQHRDVLLRLDRHRDAGLGQHGLDDERGLLAVALGWHDQREGKRRLAGLAQELLGPRDIALPHRDLRVVVGARRAHELVPGNVLAVEDGLDDRLAVDRQVQRLAHSEVRERLALRAVRYVERDLLVAQLGDAGDPEPAVRAELRQVARRDALDHLEVARSQARHARGRVGDRHELDAIEVNARLVPVVGEALEDDLALGDAFDELEGTRAHRLRGELVAERLRRLRRDHHARPVGQRGEERHQRLREVEPHGEVVERVNALDLADLGLPEGARRVQMPLDVEAHGLGVHRLAVLELDAGAQLDDDREAVGRPLVAGGELRNDLEIRGDVEELVAEAGEDQAARVGSADRRVERVGVVVQPDAQDALGPGRPRYEQQRCRGHHDTLPAHVTGSSSWVSFARDPRPSTATAPAPARATINGFTSRSTSRAPRSAASQETRTTASTTASTSSGGRPRAPVKSGAATSESSMARARSALTGAEASATSFRISTAMPPRPTITTAPNCGSRRAPTMTSARPATVSCTMNPSSRAAGALRASAAAISCAASATASGDLKPR